MIRIRLTRLTCLIVAGAVLSCALVAAALTGSPYQTVKDAVLDMAFNDNATLSMKASWYRDGELEEESTNYAEYDGKSTLTVSGSSVSYMSEDIYLFSSAGTPLGGRTWTANNYVYFNGGSAIFGLGLGADNTAELRFMELLADLLVGDLKNNMVISGGPDDGRTVSIAVSATQVPEIINAALALIWGETEEGGSAAVKNFTGEAVVDADGHLSGVELELLIEVKTESGVVTEHAFVLEAEISDYGTTVVKCPVAASEELLAVMEKNGNVWFETNPDGTVIWDSLKNMTYYDEEIYPKEIIGGAERATSFTVIG